MGIAGNSLCWKCKKEEGTYLHMIWECSLVQPFWRKILRIFEEWLGFNLPVKPQLCLLGDKSVVPNIAKNEFTLIKIGCITAARMILHNCKCPKTPLIWKIGLMKWLKLHHMSACWEDCRVRETWKNMGSFLATYKMCDEQDFLTTE